MILKGNLSIIKNQIASDTAVTIIEPTWKNQKIENNSLNVFSPLIWEKRLDLPQKSSESRPIAWGICFKIMIKSIPKQAFLNNIIWKIIWYCSA
jgi:hypothetical protein